MGRRFVPPRLETLTGELGCSLAVEYQEQFTLTYSQEELVVESIALTVVGGLGLDTTNYSIPYITSWSTSDDSLEIIETCAALIDHLAKQIEDAIGDPPPDD